MKTIKVILFLVAFLSASCALKKKEIVYKTYFSPDGKYKIEVIIFSGDEVGFPGGSGDRPGFVRLMTSGGNLIQRKDVVMVNTIEDPQWAKDSVDIKFFTEWSLP